MNYIILEDGGSEVVTLFKNIENWDQSKIDKLSGGLMVDLEVPTFKDVEYGYKGKLFYTEEKGFYIETEKYTTPEEKAVEEAILELIESGMM